MCENRSTFLSRMLSAFQYSSSRRLPSRLFSSTRRLFGASSTASSPVTPTHGSSASISSTSTRFTHGANNSVSSIASVTSVSGMSGGSVNQQRRLAEFATILGDYKLAISVCETMRKEGRGGSVCCILQKISLWILTIAFAGHTPVTVGSITSISAACRPRPCDANGSSTSAVYTIRSPCACAVQGTLVCGEVGDRYRQTRLLGLRVGG